MATDFDYGALWEGVCDIAMGSACGEENCQECQAAAAYLREQIEAAFVSRDKHRTACRVLGAFNKTYRARAEAAETEVVRLREAIKQAIDAPMIDHSPRKRDTYSILRQALGDAQ